MQRQLSVRRDTLRNVASRIASPHSITLLSGARPRRALGRHRLLTSAIRTDNREVLPTCNLEAEVVDDILPAKAYSECSARQCWRSVHFHLISSH